MQPRDLLRARTIAMVCLAVILAGATVSHALDPCVVEENPPGTVRLPPEGCAYLSPEDVHMIIDGLPDGTEIHLDPIHLAFFCRDPASNEPCLIEDGGILGGQIEIFDSVLVFQLTGTGELDGFRRILSLDAAVQTHTGPRTPGDPEQSFPTDMFQLQGSLLGDPDFAELHVIAGTGYGLPSPGQTTLTDLGDGTFQVDSFFDITYQIVFVGAPGGALDGLSGSTVGTVTMEASGEKDPCIAVDDGSGTVVLPPEDCEYLGPDEVHEIIAGLPPGTTIELDPIHADFFCPTGVCGTPGGTLGGQVESFTSNLVLQLEGTGDLDGFRRILRVPATVETHTGPRTLGDSVQSFATEMASLQGTLPPGDGDFANLMITAGSNNGLPSPGHTVLQDRGDGTFQVDSFFDISYRIDFVGAPGGALDGLLGSTESTVRMEARTGRDPLDEPDNGLGTVTVPPESGHYVSALDVHTMIDGLPPGTTIELGPSHRFFQCQTTPCGVLGGSLGGNIEVFTSTLELELTGTGDLTGLNRQITVPVDAETHTGPRITDVVTGKFVAGPAQRFDVDMFRLQGSLPGGDPDFDTLQITAGTDNALPSPGHTLLTDLGGGTFQVDSFFDITYRIDFVGAPGGALDGMSGSTTGSLRVNAVEDPTHLPRDVTIFVDARPDDANDFTFTGARGNFSLDDDADPTFPSWRRLFNMIPGPYVITQTDDSDWTLLSILCVDPDDGTTADPTTRQVTIDLDLGESITCTFTNVLTADIIFADGFESGDLTMWSRSSP